MPSFDAAVVRHQTESLEERLWTVSREWELLREHCAELAGMWNDQAAADVRRRYLEPLDEDATACLGRLDQLQQTHRKLVEQLDEIATALAAADRLAQQSRDRMRAAEVEIGRAEASAEHTRQQLAANQATLDQVNHLVNQADAVTSMRL